MILERRHGEEGRHDGPSQLGKGTEPPFLALGTPSLGFISRKEESFQLGQKGSGFCPSHPVQAERHILVPTEDR